MGRYMRKSSKNSGELALMDVASPASLGVCTRAKTLALQKSISGTTGVAGASGGSYLQLRSRRLEKPPINGGRDSKRRGKQLQSCSVAALTKNPNSNSRAGRLKMGSLVNSGSGCLESEKQEKVEKEDELVADEEEEGYRENGNKVDVLDLGIDEEEACFGENLLEFEGRERSTRETTPCSLIRDPDSVRTPGSTTRRTSSPVAIRTAEDSVRKHIPTASEMNEFFEGAEEEQQKQFIDKYNYDPVNDEPLPGRYEWVKVDP